MDFPDVGTLVLQRENNWNALKSQNLQISRQIGNKNKSDMDLGKFRNSLNQK